MNDGYPIRVLAEDEYPQLLEVDGHAFGNLIDPEHAEHERTVMEPQRTIGAFDEATLCGVASAFSFELSVPGTVAPAAGISWVGVLPVYRRRGVLRGLMKHQLQDVHDRGREAVAVLWASEAPIYGRFGYGAASRSFSLTVPRSAYALRHDAPHDESVRLRLVEPQDWKTTAPIYDQVTPTRPGMLARDDRWHAMSVIDLPARREGKSPLRCVVAEDGAGVRGYARYSTKPDWSLGYPQGVVHVREVLAADTAALASLYSYLFDLDLMGTTELWNVPVDDPLLHWLTNLRTASPRLNDALYVRLVDVGRALSQRSYSANIDIVIDVIDPLCSWNTGRWRLVGGPEGATCQRAPDGPAKAPAPLSMSVAELGAVYLGGTSLHELALAGRVTEGQPGALMSATTAFSWNPQPWNPMVF